MQSDRVSYGPARRLHYASWYDFNLEFPLLRGVRHRPRGKSARRIGKPLRSRLMKEALAQRHPSLRLRRWSSDETAKADALERRRNSFVESFSRCAWSFSGDGRRRLLRRPSAEDIHTSHAQLHFERERRLCERPATKCWFAQTDHILPDGSAHLPDTVSNWAVLNSLIG